jgi:precorrin-8X/cobalt-precorrin-8 methylmutase
MTGYLRDPQAIYRQSFERVRAAVDLDRFDPRLAPLVVRLVHACALPEIADDLEASADVLDAAALALANGAPVLVDAEMVAAGVTRAWLPTGVDIVCTLHAPGVAEAAARQGTTRSAAAVDLWADRLDGAVVAIGNAPTALFRLLELLDGGAPVPACVFAMPIGFVGAAESKDALVAAARRRALPFAALRGRFGGSALAAACVNAAARPEHSGAPS